MVDTREQEERPARQPFNPNDHLMQIKNKNGSADYLPVQWRLVWFRENHPDGSIKTEMLHLDLDRETEEEGYAWNQETRRSEKVTKRAHGIAVFHATVEDGKGGVATGTKSEKAASFPDFIEKAETGSIGRALAALGYGTQFTGDEFDEKHRIVDAPVDTSSSPTDTATTPTALKQQTVAPVPPKPTPIKQEESKVTMDIAGMIERFKRDVPDYSEQVRVLAWMNIPLRPEELADKYEWKIGMTTFRTLLDKWVTPHTERLKWQAAYPTLTMTEEQKKFILGSTFGFAKKVGSARIQEIMSWDAGMHGQKISEFTALLADRLIHYYHKGVLVDVGNFLFDQEDIPVEFRYQEPKKKIA